MISGEDYTLFGVHAEHHDAKISYYYLLKDNPYDIIILQGDTFESAQIIKSSCKEAADTSAYACDMLIKL